MEKVWWKEAIAYQIYPRSFMDSNGDGIGDLQGIISKLDYLRDLGIDVLWLCPMYASPNDDNGYDISDYKAIMAEFGTMADFDQLLQETHRRGMKLIIDLVVNHTSDEHEWFIESRSSKDNPKRDWYIWRDGKDGKEPNNWESIFGGSAWEYDEETDQYYMHLFSRKQPDLNWENCEVREAVYEMINWWLDKGIDGFRIDAISHIKKAEGLPDMPNPDGLKYVPSFANHMNVDGIDDYLTELKERTFANYDIVTVGEANGVSAADAPLWVDEAHGKMNMIFQFEHLNLWQTEERREVDIVGLKQVLTRWQKGLEGRGWNALYIENHDIPRAVSTWGDDEQYWYESATALAAMYFLMQGTPFIYQGQEIGMTNVRFPSIDAYDDVKVKNTYRLKREAGVPHETIMASIWATARDNARTPMQWSDAPHAGFTTSTPWLAVNPNYKAINVAKQSISNTDKGSRSILHFYKQLIALRKGHELFTYGTYDLLLADDRYIYAYTRTLSGERVVVICNLSPQQADYRCDTFQLHREQLLLHNYDVSPHDPLTAFALKPYETRIYRV